MNISYLGVIAVCAAASFVLTAIVRQLALRRGALSSPNERSSHVHPTPSSGGLGFLSVFVASLLFLLVFQYLPTAHHPFMVPLLVATVFTGLLGFVDDCFELSARFRLLVHLVCAVILVFSLPQPMVYDLGFLVSDLGVLSSILGILGIMWLLNLTNFMDGIDGLAAVQAILVCGIVVVLIGLTSQETVYAYPVALLGAGVLGFLFWNLPPARIFMGDVGSGTLGLLFGGFALWHAAELGPHWLYVWLLLLGILVVDATYTLLRRLLRNCSPTRAHRSHAYQRASRKFESHTKVTFACAAIVVFWLGPWAWGVAAQKINGLLALAVAYVPLLLIAKYFKAGELDD